MREITNLDELKEIELEIMKKVHKFCCTNNITYYLAYGTLLGAIRHNGFIPWDDDLDIWMFRNDYERFLKEFPVYGKKEGLYIAYKNTKPRYLRNMFKVCDERTRRSDLNFLCDDPYGVFIDVWPIDGVPDSKLTRFFYLKWIRALRGIFFYSISNPELKPEFKKSKWKKLVGLILRKIINPVSFLEYEEKLMTRYDPKKSKNVSCYGSDVLVIPPQKDFINAVLHEYEDTKFYIPKGYDNILRIRYGDYMILPKNKDERKHVADVYWL